MITRFIKAVQKEIVNLTETDIADILWLAANTISSELQEEDELLPPKVLPVPETPSSSPNKPVKPLPREKKPTLQPPEVSLHFPRSKSTGVTQTGGGYGHPISLSSPPALENGLDISRVMRLLKKREPSKTDLLLDEEKTAQSVAEQLVAERDVWIPEWRPVFTSWLELALVVDESRSMDIWRPTVTEFKQLLEHLGAFRDVRTWGLVKNHETGKMQICAGWGWRKRKQLLRTPSELIDPAGRRLILVVSDCVSRIWHDGSMSKLLEEWGYHGSVAILQVFSPRLWSRTALRDAIEVEVHAKSTNQPNKHFKFQLSDDQRYKEKPIDVPIPVMTFDKDTIKEWIQAVITAENTWTTGYIFPGQIKKQQDGEIPQEAITPEQLVKRFGRVASPLARKLLDILAAASLTLPIVRFIQHKLLPESDSSHVAEIFLSGLVKTVRENIDDPDKVEYDFVPGVRDLLIPTSSIKQTIKVLLLAEDFEAKQRGHPLGLSALLKGTLSGTGLVVDEESRSFVSIATTVLRKLGGEYAKIADQLEQFIVTAQELLKEALAITDSEARAQALIALLPHLSGTLQAEVIHEALEIMHSIASNGSSIRAWLTHLPHVPEELRAEVIREMLEAARWVANEEARVEVLDDLLQYLPEAWKAEVVRQILAATRSIANKEFRTQVLSKLLEHAPEELKSEVKREMQFIEVADDRPTLYTQRVCPSCLEEFYVGDCKIVSGKTLGKVLKEAPQDWWERRMARSNPERLDGTEYMQELARRECPTCGYLLPYNIERVNSISLAVVGDVFAGKSHYIAALIYQIKTDWINNANGYVRFMCLTPHVEEMYTKDYLEPLFKNKQVIAPTQPARKLTAEPLIYELFVYPSPNHPPTAINLMIYDASGEDYERLERLVNFARFVFNTSAFIFVADPVIMASISTQLPTRLQAELRTALTMLHITEERRAADRLNAVISLYERYHGFSTGAALPDTPIAVMVSKADLFNLLNLPDHYQFMENPRYERDLDLQNIDKVDQEVRELLRAYRQDDLLAATSRFKQVKFFATSATGEPPDATGHFAKVEPRRCLDPVLWILYQFGVISASK